MDFYLTIESPTKSYCNEKSSKFYGFAFPIQTEEEVSQNLKSLRSQFPDANHHVYAYKIGDNQRSSDDGEPSGSSGKPVLNQILSLKLDRVLVVVVRYFGGKQLGVRGLIDTYGFCAREALAAAKQIEREILIDWQLKYPYTLESSMQRLFKKYGLKAHKVEMENEGFSLLFSLPESKMQLLKLEAIKLIHESSAHSNRESQR